MRYLIGFLLTIAAFAEGVERMPWYPRYLELQPRATWRYQQYEKVDTGRETRRHASHDNFLTLSLSGAYDKWCLEIEATGAATRHQHFNLDDLSLTGRYLWLNEDVGDPVSLTTGLTATQVITLARHDISCFYHGGIEAEAHLALGSEIICEQFWRSRWWGVFGVGIADIGSPWLRGELAWEYNGWDCQRLRLFANSLWGLGHNHLTLKHHFHGYGPIRHQSVDIGLLYSYHFEAGAIVDLSYAYRAFARNCPAYANQVLVSLLYPFGL